jgi:hypothetical protein
MELFGYKDQSKIFHSRLPNENRADFQPTAELPIAKALAEVQARRLVLEPWVPQLVRRLFYLL